MERIIMNTNYESFTYVHQSELTKNTPYVEEYKFEQWFDTEKQTWVLKLNGWQFRKSAQ